MITHIRTTSALIQLILIKKTNIRKENRSFITSDTVDLNNLISLCVINII